MAPPPDLGRPAALRSPRATAITFAALLIGWLIVVSGLRSTANLLNADMVSIQPGGPVYSFETRQTVRKLRFILGVPAILGVVMSPISPLLIGAMVWKWRRRVFCLWLYVAIAAVAWLCELFCPINIQPIFLSAMIVTAIGTLVEWRVARLPRSCFWAAMIAIDCCLGLVLLHDHWTKLN